MSSKDSADDQPVSADQLVAKEQDGSADQEWGEEEDLRAGLTGLSKLATHRLGLEELLMRVADYAVQAIPGADGASLSLLETDRSNTVVSTTVLVSKVDEIQYGIGQGPFILAAAEGRTVISGSLGADERWRKFGGAVARLGVHSVISLPLITADGVLGAMNVYASEARVRRAGR